MGWQYAIDVENNSRKVQCKFCSKIFSGGIFRFKHHLACTHKNVEPCLKVPDDTRKEILVKNAKATEQKRMIINSIDDSENENENNEIQQVTSKQKGKNTMDTFVTKGKWSSSATGSGQTTLNQMLKRELREDCCQQIARFFYACAIPFNCVKHPEFAKMLELVGKFGSGLKPPSYHDIRVKYLKKEVTHTMELLEEYKTEWKKIGCSIMSDGWTDKKRRSICNFLVNSPKGTVFLTSIDTSDFSKIADKVCEMLDVIVEKVGEENVVQVVTDNAANYKAAGEMLMEKRKRLYWTPCAAHCIDLMLEDFEKKLRVHAITIRKARRISTYIYSRTLLISMLRQFTKRRDLITPAVTRFATAYLTLGCLSELKGALMTMFISNSWKSSRFVSQQDGRRVQQTVLDSRFWKNMIHCLKAALPLVKVLRLVDSDEKPTMGFIYVEMDRAKEKIKANFNNVKKK
ncbi:uncharacterized protein LOC127790982 [Diospyros lotus]|uniref:uncharacterized protein LOC127790982 n=1 Tax=Diospyros lotus TaxID=55363 RepID=UPI0022577D91|nr:uncharacterized protein LOC127790982 [Diospyros lotus]